MSGNYQRLFTGMQEGEGPGRTPAGVGQGIPEGIEAVTFDAGGTLIHAWPSVGTVYAEALRGRGLEADPKVLEQRFLQAYKRATEAPRERIDLEAERAFWRSLVESTLEGYCPADTLDAVFQEVWDGFASARHWRFFPGARETVEQCRQRGYRVFLLSNADSRFRQTFTELELIDTFEELFISSEIGYEKPDLRIFRYVQERIGCRPESILHVGDSAYHDGAARELGWQVRILGEDIEQLPDLL